MAILSSTMLSSVVVMTSLPCTRKESIHSVFDVNKVLVLEPNFLMLLPDVILYMKNIYDLS
jgi:hypothetical protein